MPKINLQFYSVFTPCELCGDFFQDDAVKYGDNFYHWHCLFVCHECGNELIEGERLLFEDGHWIHESHIEPPRDMTDAEFEQALEALR